MDMNDLMTSGASGSLHDGVDLDAHMSGVNPAQRKVNGQASPFHGWLIIVGLLVLLWLFGGAFRKVLS